MGTFSAKVSEMVQKRKDLIDEVFRRSVQGVASIAQTPGPSKASPGGGRGGHMPIDSGFLRASLVAILNGGMPTAREKPAGDGKFSFEDGAVNLVIAGATVDDTITLAWTANYARHVNHRYRFRDLAAQQWTQIVERNAAEVAREAGL